MNKKLKQKLRNIGWTIAVSVIFGAVLTTVLYLVCGLLSLLFTSIVGA